MVIEAQLAQQSADALTAHDRSGRRGAGWRLDEPTIEALVLGVVVGDVFSDVSTRRGPS
jgi:hypothetical protein